MENRIKKSQLAISLLLLSATFAAADLGMATLLSTTQVISANASTTPIGRSTETNEIIAPRSNNNNSISLAEKPFLVEHGRTVAATPINQTHMQVSLAGNGTITLPNSTETVMTNDTGNAIARLTPTGNIVNGQIHISTEDGNEKATVFFTEIGQNEKGIGVAYFSTNSTGKLAFLNNMIGVIQDQIQPNGNTLISAFEWKGEE